MSEPSLTSSAVTDLTDVEPRTLRKWRFHGFLGAYGTADAKGHWTYSLRDAVALWAGFVLISEHRTERARALQVAYVIAPDLIAAVRGTGGVRYFSNVYTDLTAAGGSRGWETWRSNTLAELAAVPGFVAADDFKDIEALAARVPPELRAAILDAAE